MGGQWLRWLLLAVVLASPAADVRLAAQTADETFLASLGELREATFVDKEAIAERMIADGPSARARRADGASRRSAVQPHRRQQDLHRQDHRRRSRRLCARRSGLGNRRRRGAAGCPGEDRQQQQAPAIAQNHARTFRTLESRSGGTTRRDPGHAALARRADRRASAGAQGGRNRRTRPDGDRHGPRDGRPRRNRHRRTPRSHRQACRAGLARTCGTDSPSLVEQSPDGTFVEPTPQSGLQPQRRWSRSIRIERSIPRSRRSSSASAWAPCSC